MKTHEDAMGVGIWFHIFSPILLRPCIDFYSKKAVAFALKWLQIYPKKAVAFALKWL